MAQLGEILLLPLILFFMVIAMAEATSPSYAKCMIRKYKLCYDRELACPSSCPSSCTVECASCKSVCLDGFDPLRLSVGRSLKESDDNQSNNNNGNNNGNNNIGNNNGNNNGNSNDNNGDGNGNNGNNGNSNDNNGSGNGNNGKNGSNGNNSNGNGNGNSGNKSPPPPEYHTPPSYPPPPPSSPSKSTPATPPPPATPTPTPPSPPPPPPSPTPPIATPTSQPPTPSSPAPPPPTTRTPTPSSPPPPTSPTPPTPTPSSPSPSTPSSSPKTAKCGNPYYRQCYDTEHVCPSSCPGGCEVDCVACKPVCKCDRPGSVCQDPRFIGGDGITFYFHGEKDHDFCLVSDPNLHINAHFIGKRNEKMTRDFTWVQSITILFGNHQIFLGALKTSIWDDSVDRLALSFDGEPVSLLENEGSRWQSTSLPGVSITRISNTNNVVVEVEGDFKITAKVVPITEEDSRIHNYGITQDDCFAHLDLGFKFYSLSDEVNGVLGQTYRPGYVSPVNIGAKMPVMGGNKEFQTSSLVAADCAVARFNGGNSFNAEGYLQGSELPGLSCASGIDGQGVVCKR